MRRGSISSSAIHWSREGDSSIDAFLDGQKMFSFDGPLGYRNEIKGPYFKLGVYASGEITGPLVVYHDNYSRARQLCRGRSGRRPRRPRTKHERRQPAEPGRRRFASGERAALVRCRTAGSQP